MTEATLFERVIQIPAAERADSLDRECAGQPELRARVEALLAADAASHSPLDRSVAVPDRTGEYTPQLVGQPAKCVTTDHRPNDQAGTLIAGKYTLVEVIGEGSKRAGGRQVELADVPAPLPDDELLALDAALERLAAIKPDHARLVELRYFAGQSGDEAAAAINVSPATADRMWRFARAWLQVETAGS